jgi:hypothetical protein
MLNVIHSPPAGDTLPQGSGEEGEGKKEMRIVFGEYPILSLSTCRHHSNEQHDNRSQRHKHNRYLHLAFHEAHFVQSGSIASLVLPLPVDLCGYIRTGMRLLHHRLMMEGGGFNFCNISADHVGPLFRLMGGSLQRERGSGREMRRKRGGGQGREGE